MQAKADSSLNASSYELPSDQDQGWEIFTVSPPLSSMKIVAVSRCNNRTQRCAEDLTW